MNFTGMKRWAQSLSQLSTGFAAMIVLLAGSGCTGSQNVRKARPMAIEVEAPDKIEIVASEAPAVSEADVEVAAEVETSPSPAQDEAVSPEAELLAAVTKGENGVAEALQQTRGAVFASLTTPTGAGPPASAVKASDEASFEEGLQDSSTQLTGTVEGAAEAGGVGSGAEPATEDPPQEETEAASENETIQEEAESSIAETSPSPEPVAPQESVEAPAVEATRVAPPPDPEPVPVSEDVSREGLTTNNPAGAGVEEGTQSNSASVLFLILGGIGAALILLRKRVAA